VQKKVGTILEESLLARAKEAAHAHRTNLSRLFEEALSEYLARRGDATHRLSLVETSFGSMHLPPSVLHRIAQEDPYEIE
jgi:hypothetical protein